MSPKQRLWARRAQRGRAPAAVSGRAVRRQRLGCAEGRPRTRGVREGKTDFQQSCFGKRRGSVSSRAQARRGSAEWDEGTVLLPGEAAQGDPSEVLPPQACDSRGAHSSGGASRAGSHLIASCRPEPHVPQVAPSARVHDRADPHHGQASCSGASLSSSPCPLP